jgi:predicted ATPase
MKSITKIVLTGGPAGGKTTLTSRLVKELSSIGYRVFIVPEAATELISQFGIKPFGNCLSMFDFQYFVVSSQLHKEKMAWEAAQLVPEDKILIICYRGVIDDKAYVSQKEFNQVISRFGLTEKELLESYDAVIHLVSSSKGAEFAYNYDNAARYATLEQAREKEDATLLCWRNHKNRVVIGNSYNFDNKIRKAMNEVYSILGEIPPAQSERKFLIEYVDESDLAAYQPVEQHITQTYLKARKQGTERRTRKVVSNNAISYFYSEKRPISPIERIENERLLSEKEYIRKNAEVDPEYGSVSKRRFCFIYNGRYCTVDTYPTNPNSAILDVQLNDKDEQVDLPPEIKVIKEVTGDVNYQGHMISKGLAQM